MTIPYQEMEGMKGLSVSETSSIPGIQEYILTFGGKALVLSINRHTCQAATWVQNTGGPHVPSETTTLYKQAKFIMEREAKYFGPIHYMLETGFSSMKSWALSAGDRLFHWERTYYSVDDPFKLVAFAIIEAPDGDVPQAHEVLS